MPNWYYDGWLTIAESERLLYRIFPNYPQTWPVNPVPPQETWKEQRAEK